jgi:Chitin binding Peritrophin-A domain
MVTSQCAREMFFTRAQRLFPTIEFAASEKDPSIMQHLVLALMDAEKLKSRRGDREQPNHRRRFTALRIGSILLMQSRLRLPFHFFSLVVRMTSANKSFRGRARAQVRQVEATSTTMQIFHLSRPESATDQVGWRERSESLNGQLPQHLELRFMFVSLLLGLVGCANIDRLELDFRFDDLKQRSCRLDGATPRCAHNVFAVDPHSCSVQFYSFLFFFSAFVSGSQPPDEIPKTSFSCRGRVSGYYADTETDCQVYHMCDQQGRQFDYTCPNATLFQQRMLICDHWYMVDCSSSEANYAFNELIGQRVMDVDECL